MATINVTKKVDETAVRRAVDLELERQGFPSGTIRTDFIPIAQSPAASMLEAFGIQCGCPKCVANRQAAANAPSSSLKSEEVPLYTLLGVSPTSSDDEIASSIRTLIAERNELAEFRSKILRSINA